MKKYTWGACFVLLCAAFSWSTKIEWQWKGAPIFTVDRLGSRLELGLRDDGVVMWREITNVTNSPAEQPWVATNLVSTNIWIYGVPMPQSLPKEWFYNDGLPKFFPN